MSVRISAIVMNVEGRSRSPEELADLLFPNQTVRDFECIEAHIDGSCPPGAVLNAALDAAVGEYVMFACVGDRFVPDAVEQVLHCIEDNYLDLIVPYQVSACSPMMLSGARSETSYQDDSEVRRPGTPLHAQSGPCIFPQLSATLDSASDMTGFVLRKGFMAKYRFRFDEELYYPYRLFSAKAILFSERVDTMCCSIYLHNASEVPTIIGEIWIASEFLTNNILETFVLTEQINLDPYELRCVSSYLYHVRCRLARLCSEGKPFNGEALRYRDSLSLEQRMLFDEVVLELGHHLSRIAVEMEETMTFRVGRRLSLIFGGKEAKE